VNTTTSGGVTTRVLQTENRTYNAMGQMTSIDWPSLGCIQLPSQPSAAVVSVIFTPQTQNNGQIQQMADALSGETVVYQYDALKRVASASSTPMSGSAVSAWAQTFQYDGFGNLTGRNGSAGMTVNAATNQLRMGITTPTGI